MALKQAQRRLAVTTPLGDDALVLAAFAGHEEISRLFGYQLDMISDNDAVDARKIVGKNVTFSVAMADDSPRYFNGFVSRFFAGDEDLEGRRNYRAEVVPWLWFLTRTSDCRIFQSKSAPDIIQQIFKDLGFSDFKLQLSGKHPQRDYCVQYRETDFNFVSRLMEEEGIFYFFKHEQGKHTLVLADAEERLFRLARRSEVDYPRDPGSRAKEDHITRWEHCYEFRTGKWAQTDYNFEDHPPRPLAGQADDDEREHDGQSAGREEVRVLRLPRHVTRKKTTATATPRSAWRKRRSSTTWCRPPATAARSRRAASSKSATTSPNPKKAKASSSR